jgi:ankyrin repeat protein
MFGDLSGDSYMSPTMAVSCKKGHVNVVKILLENGMSATMADEVGHSPISIAALHGKDGVCKFLIESGGNVHALTNDLRRVSPTL